MTALRTLAFGDDSVWGASWCSDSGGAALTALGDGPQTMSMPGVGLSEDGADASGEWRLEATDVALVASPAGELVDVRAAEDGLEGWDQMCRVTGRFGEHEVDCLGLRSSWADGVDLTRFASIRAVSVWFGPEEAFALTAFRPRKAKHHDDDLLAAAVLGRGSAPLDHLRRRRLGVAGRPRAVAGRLRARPAVPAPRLRRGRWGPRADRCR
jgi:hypothetical protein